MRGGNRTGAGRKNIPDDKKKRMRPVYLTDDEYNRIMDIRIGGADNFSQKCARLMEIGMKEIQKHQSMNLFDDADIGIADMDNADIHNGENSNTLHFIDLFAGIGGIRKGFEDEHTECVFSSEWDKYAAKTYEANYGEVPDGDITKIDAHDIPDHDVLLAGFPCQPFSNIGKREGFAHETQGTLFFDVLRILQTKQPKMFLLENVKGLLTNDHGNTFKIIIENLKRIGYTVFHQVLDAQNFGLPQRRERIVIVGFRGDLQVKEFEFPKGTPDVRIPVKAILEHSPEGYSISKHLQKSYLFKKDDGRPQLVDFDSDVQVNTLCASYHKIQRLTGTFVKDGETGIRMFSELELKRMMGFPDDFKVPVSRTQMYRQFGNSVAVPMIREVADAMKKKYMELQLTH